MLLEEMVIQDMLAKGYKPHFWLDVETYWAELLG